MYKKSIIVFLLLSLLVNFTACSAKNSDKGETKAENIIYASVYPIYDFAKKIGGDKVKVALVIPPGAEPHGWEPSAKLMGEIEKSRVFLYNGLDLDPWAERMANSLSKNNTIALAMGEIDSIQPMVSTEGEGNRNYDPHIWLDPIIAIEMAREIKDIYIKIDQENAHYFENNFTKFKEELEKLDQHYNNTLSKTKYKNFIVTHAAFGYLANRYNLKQIAILGLTPHTEPSPGKLAELTSLIKKHKIHTIFFEHLTNPKAVEVLAKETKVKIEVLNPIGALTQKEMDRGEDYISIMKENLDKLQKALN